MAGHGQPMGVRVAGRMRWNAAPVTDMTYGHGQSPEDGRKTQRCRSQ